MSNEEATRKLLPSVDPSFFNSPHAWETETGEDKPKPRHKSPQRKPKSSHKKGKPKEQPSVFDRLGEKPTHHEKIKIEKHKNKDVEEEKFHKAPSLEKKSVFDRLGTKQETPAKNTIVIQKATEKQSAKPSIFDRLGSKPKSYNKEAETNMDIGSRPIVKGKVNRKKPHGEHMDGSAQKKSNTVVEKSVSEILQNSSSWADAFDDEAPIAIPKWND
ncbi:hypothetical protein HDV04_005663 [Boothiomyces sp. JEL0838]|nr:hypothetical protein HDV04_005663 [Boothiomyces sp. JEL0838]